MTVLNRHASGSLRGRIVVHVVGSTSLLLFVAALAIQDALGDRAVQPGSCLRASP